MYCKYSKLGGHMPALNYATVFRVAILQKIKPSVKCLAIPLMHAIFVFFLGLLI